ncbi:hypothetical protein HDE_09140 [Halotydeus destructor]|nr:hypothetical protein HDE_09140 [Halotydeus destructor]
MMMKSLALVLIVLALVAIAVAEGPADSLGSAMSGTNAPPECSGDIKGKCGCKENSECGDCRECLEVPANSPGEKQKCCMMLVTQAQGLFSQL